MSSNETMQRLTFGGNNRFPIWSGDSKRVAFQSDREGDLGILWQAAIGGKAERLTKADQGTSHAPESWSPKGDTFLYSVTKESEVSLRRVTGIEEHPIVSRGSCLVWRASVTGNRGTPNGTDAVTGSRPTRARCCPSRSAWEARVCRWQRRSRHYPYWDRCANRAS